MIKNTDSDDGNDDDDEFEELNSESNSELE